MPANRSRTERWRELMEQIAERGGGIEFSVARTRPAGEKDTGSDLMWRVRLISVDRDRLLVEHPTAAGRPVHLGEDIDLVGVMTVGQNKWMFHTRTMGTCPLFPGSRATGLRLAVPSKVERCYRRDFLRIATAELRLPRVECFQLLEPSTVVAAETANRERILECIKNPAAITTFKDDLLPEVGPRFTASLMNLGGGGVGLLIPKEDASGATNPKLLWLRINLTPQIPLPIAITAKQAHTHIDSAQNLYLGLAFEFAFNPGHRDFVIDQITRYVNLLAVRKAA